MDYSIPKFLFALIAVLCCSGCERGDKAHGPIHVVSLFPQEGEIAARTSELGAETACVMLEIPNGLLLGEPTTVMETRGSIYVADQNTLFEFTPDGKYKRSIEKRGSGPDEYLGISDVVIDDASNCWILSKSNKTIFCFDQQGVLVKRLALNDWVSKMALVDTHTLALYIGNEADEENNHRIKFMDMNNGTITGEDLWIDPIRAGYLHIQATSNFSAVDRRSIHLYETFNDTVYEVTARRCVPKYRLDLNGKNIPRSFFQTPYAHVMEFFQALHKNTYAYGCGMFMETKNGAVCSYFYQGRCHLSVGSNSRGQSKEATCIVEDRKLCGYPIELVENKLFPQPDGRLIIPIESETLKEYLDTHSSERCPDLYRRMKGAETTVLVILQF